LAKDGNTARPGGIRQLAIKGGQIAVGSLGQFEIAGIVDGLAVRSSQQIAAGHAGRWGGRIRKYGQAFE
jgi:hypothetical protein